MLHSSLLQLFSELWSISYVTGMNWLRSWNQIHSHITTHLQVSIMTSWVKWLVSCPSQWQAWNTSRNTWKCESGFTGQVSTGLQSSHFESLLKEDGGPFTRYQLSALFHCTAVVLALSADAYTVCKWMRNLHTYCKFRNAYQWREIGKRMTHLKSTFTTGFIKWFSEMKCSQTVCFLFKILECVETQYCFSVYTACIASMILGTARFLCVIYITLVWFHQDTITTLFLLE